MTSLENNTSNPFRRFSFGLIALIAFSSIGCGGSIEDLAMSILYPYEQVNKKYPVPETPPAELHNVTFDLKQADGTDYHIHGWFYRNPKPNVNTVVYFHGNGENLASLNASNFLGVMKSLGANFVVIDYPMYGRSTGTPSEETLIGGAKAAIDWAAETFPRGEVIVWGRSIGASVATLSYRQRQDVASRLILTSPWTTFYEVALKLSGLAKQIPKEWLAKNTYDSVANAQQIKGRVLIHHGVIDKLVPIEFGRLLSTKFIDQKYVTMVEFPTRDHNDIFLERQLWEDVRDYLK